MAGKITNEELHSSNKTGILSDLNTTKKGNLVEAINEVNTNTIQNINLHKEESMPHQFTDVDNKKYKYGFKTNTNKDGLIFVYEEVL